MGRRPERKENRPERREFKGPSNDKQKSIKDRATKRIMKDLLEIKRNPLSGISALPLENNLFLWHANLLGPVNTPWEGGIFHMTITIPTEYPNKPPSILLMTKISHPNVIGNKICLDILEQTGSKGGGWTPSYTIQSLLVQLQSFLFEAEVSKILANIENPKDYEVKKKEWLSGVKWSVEQSINYKDSTVNHYPPKKPWPPINKLDEKSLILTEEERVNSELTCYYTKQTFNEDALGYGVTITKNLRTGELKSIFANLDFVSLRAFNNHKLRTSSTNSTFTHWLPVYINEKNGKKAVYLTERAISIICTGTHDKFKPSMVLDIYPKLMSTMIVEVMTDKKVASLRAFRAYYSFYRMLAQFVTIYPEIKKEANRRVQEFIEDDKKRHKDVTPNLGEFLSFLSITDYKWDDIRDSYIKESFTRNVFWLLNKHKDEFVDEQARLNATFDSAKDSYKILCFHLFFLKSIKTVKLEDIDKNYGFPTLDVEDKFFSAVEKINLLDSIQNFFKSIGIEKTEKEIVQLLLDSIQNSKDKEYHGAKMSVLSPEEFSKQNAITDLEKLKVVNEKGEKILSCDESLWKENLEKRWGFSSFPEYLNDSKTPYKSFYLQNHIQDLISDLNNVLDFKTYHQTLESISDFVTRLEVPMINPSNIKSKYHFITIFMTKLKNLETLIIKKGEIGLGYSGFKCLIKGFSNSSGSLKTLILENCNLNADSIKVLTKTGSLISGNLRYLNLNSNPLGDLGATYLAEFLKQHKVLPELVELDLSSCQINQTGADAISEVILVKRKLEKIIMKNNNVGQGFDNITKNGSYSTTLKIINSSNSNLQLINQGSKSLASLFKLSQSIEEVILWKSKNLVLGRDVFLGLKDNNTLKKLDLAETGFRSLNFLGEALNENKSLKQLYLDGNSIINNDIVAFIKELKNSTFNIDELSLVSNNFSQTMYNDDKKIFQKLITFGKSLKILKLDNSNITRDMTDPIGDAFKSEDIRIEFLSLKRNKLIGKYGMKAFVEGVSKNKYLKKLDISGCDLQAIGLKFVAQILEKNESIEDLNLFGNFGEIEGCIELSKALEVNKTLKKLDLGLNRIRSRGASHLIESLEKNSTLESIGLKNNKIPDKMLIKLQNFLISSKVSSIKYISIAGNEISEQTLSTIATEFSKFQQDGGRKIEFDLYKLVLFKDPEKMQRTIFISPLSNDITEHQLKKVFYTQKCGVCLNVSIYDFKKKKSKAKAKYAFIEFAHQDSIKLSIQLMHKKDNFISNNKIIIMKAGIEIKKK